MEFLVIVTLYFTCPVAPAFEDLDVVLQIRTELGGISVDSTERNMSI